MCDNADAHIAARRRRTTFDTAGAVMPHVMAGLRPPSTAWLDTLQQRWEVLVGPGIAAQTAPESIEGTTLIVRVANHVWLAELRGGLGRQVQEKVNREITGAITRIRWIT